MCCSPVYFKMKSLVGKAQLWEAAVGTGQPGLAGFHKVCMPSFQPQLQQNFTWPLPSLANDFYSLALKRFCLEVYPTVHVYTLHQWHILGFQVFDHYSVYPGRKIVSLCLLSPNKLCLWPFYLRHKSSSLSVSSYSVLPMNWTHHSHLYSKNSWSAVLHVAYAL